MDRPDSMSQVSAPDESRHDNAAFRSSAVSAYAASDVDLTPEYEDFGNQYSHLQDPNSIPMGDVHFNNDPPELGDDEQPPKFQAINPNSAKLNSSSTPLFLVLVYTAFAVPSWVIICYLSLRPITTDHYGYWVKSRGSANYERYAQEPDDVATHASIYARNERWYHAALVIQSILSIFAIPLVSAICSYAAVVFIQRKLNRGGLSMRQVMTLADRGWLNVPTYFKILTKKRGWKRYGSSFLLFAVGLSILTILVSGPLQQILLFSKSVKVPTISSIKEDVWQISDIASHYSIKRGDFSNTHWLLTRQALESTSSKEQPDLLWGGHNASCSSDTYSEDISSTECNLKGTSLGDINQPDYPFFAPLSHTTNTGLIKQFLSRVNSTASYESIPQDEFPKDCEKAPGAFYVNYLNVDEINGTTWGLEVCMPSNMSKSPWQAIRTRQDFTEELYINMTWIENLYSSRGYPNERSWYKLIINTTAGYFELPNYMNGGKPGEILEGDPLAQCKEGEDCQFSSHNYNYKRSETIATESKTKRDDSVDLPLANVINKGPLLTIAIALFGPGSFIQTRYDHPEYYGTQDISVDGCLWQLPMSNLIPDSDTSYLKTFESCIEVPDGGWNGTQVTWEIMRWLSLFSYDQDSLSTGFTAAAFLATQFWVQKMDDVLDRTTPGTMVVASDMGADTQVPVLSRGGLIAVSVLLGLNILLLLAVAVYATVIPRWTSTMDSWVMMRMGAAVADKIPLLIGRKTDSIGTLDTIPGCIGDQSREADYTGRLGLGADRPLDWKKDRRFECYSSDAQRLDKSTRSAPYRSRVE